MFIQCYSLGYRASRVEPTLCLSDSSIIQNYFKFAPKNLIPLWLD